MNTTSIKKSIGLLRVIVMAAMLAIIGATFVVPATASAMPVMQVVPWTPEANQASYWDNYLDTTCVKVDESGPFKTMNDYDYVVLKGGQWNNIYFNVSAGTRFTEVSRGDKQPAGISHYFLCGKHKPPPPPKPKPEILKVEFSCVAKKPGGPKNQLFVKTTVNTHGPVLPLKQVVKLDLDNRSPLSWDKKTWRTTDSVQNYQVIKKRHYAGPGRHYVSVNVTLGSKTAHKDGYIKCADIVFRPKAKFFDTRGDPWEHWVLNNRMNTTTQRFEVTGIGRNGWFRQVVDLRGSCKLKSGWRWFKGGTTAKIKWVKPNGKKVLLDSKVIPPPDYYGPLYPIKDKGVTCY